MLTVLVITAIILVTIKALTPPKNIRHLPSISLISTFISWLKDEPMDKITNQKHLKILEKHGILRFWCNGRWRVIITNEEAVKQVYSNANSYPKAVMPPKFKNSIGQKFLGSNVLFSNGDEWKMHRKGVTAIFRTRYCPEKYQNSISKLINKIENEGRVEIASTMSGITLDFLGKSIFDVDFNAVQNDDSKFLRVYKSITSKPVTIFDILCPWLPQAKIPILNKKYKELEWFENEFDKILEQKRSESLEDKDLDLFGCMIKDNSLSKRHMIDNCKILFLAGHETSATALCAALHLMALNTDVQQKARDEAIKNIKAQVPTNEELKALNYLTLVIKETLRLYPPVAKLTDKICKKPLKVGQYMLDKDVSISIDVMAMCKMESTFKDAFEFKPERFEAENNYGISYTPFSSGSRTCLGMRFAMDSQLVIISSILRNYKFEYEAPLKSLPMTQENFIKVKPFYLKFTKIN